MRCPICGAKMVNKQLCQYCNITDEQIYNASNKKAKKVRKEGNSDLIHFTTIVPKDVERLKLILFTIFLGVFGVNHLYINRLYRGIYSIVSMSLFVLFVILTFVGVQFLGFFNIVYQIVGYAGAINVILWVSDIINVLIKKMKIPVVLAEKGEKNG